MLENVYRGFLNAVAYSQLVTRAIIPDRLLCIGEAEQLQSIPVLIYKELKPKQKRPEKESVVSQPYEKVSANFSGDVLSIDDFNQGNFDVGEPVVRW